MADWNEIKAEYIAGGTSYRKLAKKFEVSESQLTKIAIRERWVDLREQAESEAEAEIVKSVAKQNSATEKKFNRAVDKLLEKITDVIIGGSFKDTQSIKHLTSALKDIRDIKGIKGAKDLEEQQARIDKLRKEAEQEKSIDNNIEICFTDGDVEEWSE